MFEEMTNRDMAEFINNLMHRREPRPVLGKITPSERISAIYGLFDGDELVYIGITDDMDQRIRCHSYRGAGKQFDTFAWEEIPKAFGNRDFERRLIRAFEPKYNFKQFFRKKC